MTKAMKQLYDLARSTGLPVIVDGDRSRPTGKTSLCNALRAAGVSATEQWEFEEGGEKKDQPAYLLILLNEPMQV